VSWRLNTIAPDIVEELEREEEPQLRLAAERVAGAALREADVRDETVERALRALGDGRYGDSEERSAIKALADRLDELAWDIQERVDSGEADQKDYLAAFRKARAATALWFALDGDPRTAAIEAAYEAQAATDDGVVRREIAASGG
jgi:hypothetical protein